MRQRLQRRVLPAWLVGADGDGGHVEGPYNRRITDALSQAASTEPSANFRERGTHGQLIGGDRSALLLYGLRANGCT